MNELSERFKQAAEFLKKSRYVKSYSEIAKRLGMAKSTISECMNGSKPPTWGMLLDFCDAYPIDFQWIRTGAGDMVKGDREAALLKRIAELERMLEQLKE